MDISFQEKKKRFKNPILGYQDIKQKNSLIFFGTPCTKTMLTTVTTTKEPQLIGL